MVGLYAEVAGPDSGVALAAVGSLARRELGPRSDLDLVLMHDGRNPRAVDHLAQRLWYPLWDARVRLDHSVRTPAECADVAGRELSAGVGLLDLRAVAGDLELVTGARTALIEAWRRNARKRLPELLSSLDDRLATAGDAAYLLEPDLKEARGGFRDISMLRALAATWLTDQPHVGIQAPHALLLDVRDALHLVSGRSLDRLISSEVPAVMTQLGYADPDELHRDISLAARAIGQAVSITVRAARQALPQRTLLSFARRERRPSFVSAEHGLIIHAGEVGLGPSARPETPATGLQAGALAVQRGLQLSPVTAENLGARSPALSTPWPEPAREALLQLLAGGPGLIAVWETLDLVGCIQRWIPAWTEIRARPQYNHIHRHTVDRHSVQTVAEAQRHLTHVERPDLLLLAALFHDIGKIPGAGADHPRVGAPIALAAVTAIGLSSADAGLVELLVAEHLTLAELATRRDHQDPATLEALITAVRGRADVLALLRHLTESDARAAGPAAWSPWRAQLINALADRAEEQLSDGPPSADPRPLVDLGLARAVLLDGRPRITIESMPGGPQLVIASRDRVGLFADTAGLLVAAGLQVRAAALQTVEGVAVNTWRVDKLLASELPDPAFVIQQLERLEAGDRTVLDPVRRRESRVRSAGSEFPPYVQLVRGASASAAVVEVRTADRPGLIYALGASVAGLGLSIRSAHVATLAGQAIDTFYLTEPDGRLPLAERCTAAVDGLTSAALAQVAPAS